MRTALPLIAATLGLTFAVGCVPESEQPDSDAYARALPDDRILVSMPVAGNRAVGDLAESYLTTADATEGVNGMIGDVLGMVDHITDFDPTYTEDDDKFLWGPWSDGGLDPNETALYVELDATAELYGWAIVQRPKTSTSDDDWVAIVIGEADVSETDDVASGVFAVDFDAIATLNPTETTAGVFFASYDIAGGVVEAEAGFEEFTDDTGNPERLNAIYVYSQDDTGAGQMDLGWLSDLQEDGSAEETVVLRSRWMADGRGRGDLLAFDGDLSPLVYQGTECWDSAFGVVYEENNAEMHMEGDEAQCVFGDPDWDEDPADS